MKLYARALVSSLRRGRRSRVPALLVTCSLLFLGMFWLKSDSIVLPAIPIPYHRVSPMTALPFADVFVDEPQLLPLLAPQPNITRVKGQLQSTSHGPYFHVLIPASEANDKLCKNLLSAFVLNYPPPTLINFGVNFTGEGWDKGTHAGKIKGVYDFLSKNQKIRDNDLVLVIDGYDVWFQLPPELMVRRYLTLIEEANNRLRSRYGTIVQQRPWEGGQKRKAQKYVQTVIFGADKICWPNPAEDPACASLPDSTLPTHVYGPNTDRDSEAFLNRPKYLNSGTVIGPVYDVRAIYERALEKVEQGRGAVGDQFVFAEILGEQEYQRQTSSKIQVSWYSPLLKPLSLASSHSSTQKAVKNMTLAPGQRYDFSIGLDYASLLFQTMTHSVEDIAFITYANATSYSVLKSPPRTPLVLPTDVFSSRPPFPTNNTLAARSTNQLLPFSLSLDILPPPSQNSWLNIPLATNLFSHATPTLLHINGDKSLLDSWWHKTWFQPHARALLRTYMRTPQPFLLGTYTGEERTWDRRGGRGGVWTSEGWWVEWGDVCEGVEGSVFGDGKGSWGQEEGDGRTWNWWGQQVTGKVVKEGGK